MLTLDPGRHQPATCEIRHDGADRCSLTPCKLSSGRDDVVIDVERRSHGVMLAHHRITAEMADSRAVPTPLQVVWLRGRRSNHVALSDGDVVERGERRAAELRRRLYGYSARNPFMSSVASVQSAVV